MPSIVVPAMHTCLMYAGFACLALAASYGALTMLGVLVWRIQRPSSSHPRIMPPVTLLKPLCGAEPGLYAQLRSFCVQDYHQFQVVFGVRDPADPALAIVQRLRAEFPRLPIDVVINPQLHGSNYKVSNLINMIPQAHHEVLAIADSDTSVNADYLRCVTAPLLDRQVGLVTCLYRDVPTSGVWSRLGAMYINEWYMPSVLLARLFGHDRYASGQTLCLRRQTLQAIGGFEAIANHLADDYRLGELVCALGLKIVLSPTAVDAEHHEQDLDSLMHHELRWMRTIRTLRPRSFRLLFLSFTLPLALAGFMLAAAAHALTGAAWVLLGIAVLSRLVLHRVHRTGGHGARWADLWLIPLRDAMLSGFWLLSFFGSRVTWRGGEFDVDADGIMHRSP
jgi:ceramide glucosyltransferase